MILLPEGAARSVVEQLSHLAFALADPHVRLSRIRPFPKVAPKHLFTPRKEEWEEGETLNHSLKASQVRLTAATRSTTSSRR